jgi:hypothetical protein
VHPVPTAPPAVLAARRAIAEAKLARAKRAAARRLAREPWRDPASEHYDPLRVLLEKSKGEAVLAAARCVCGSRVCSGACKRRLPWPKAMLGGLALLTLTACATPQVRYIDRVRFVDRVQQVVKPIDPELLQLHPIAEGPLSQCLSVAAQRRAELVKCNADKAAINGIAGAKGQGDE